MGLSGLEPPTSRLSGVRSNRLSYKPLLLSFSNAIISLRSMRCTFSLRFKLYLFSLCEKYMGLSGLEPPTSRLSGVRSNRLSYKPLLLTFGNTIISLHPLSSSEKCSGIHLLSHIVSNIVPSADWVLTIVFGMGTGVSPRRIDTANVDF